MKTLEEKFINANINSVEFAWMDANGVKECVKIAEDFAIGFAEWAVTKNMGVNKFTLYEGELEIYKKEKGL